MENEIAVAICSLVGTLVGSLAGIMTANRLTNYRIEQLEEKVKKHNNLVERMIIVEQSTKSAAPPFTSTSSLTTGFAKPVTGIFSGASSGAPMSTVSRPGSLLTMCFTPESVSTSAAVPEEPVDISGIVDEHD